MKRPAFLFALLVIILNSISLSAQTGDHELYGDLTVDESNVTGLKPLTFDVILYSETNVLVSRQPVANNGRYRFNNLPIGVYQLVIEVENSEIARISVDLRSPLLKQVRRDIALEWRLPANPTKASLLSVTDAYVRTAENEKLFRIASKAKDTKQYSKAASLLQQIVNTDPKDFQAWFELGNVHFLQKDRNEAENDYLRAIDTHPRYFLALLNLGRLELSQKHFDVAIEVLRRAVKTWPDSADANYFLGEAYLQDKKGSAAVVYFNEALRLDPEGMAEVHLRLALLYVRAGMKGNAAAEYEKFLAKKPDYPDRKKLQQYIAANRASSNPRH